MSKALPNITGPLTWTIGSESTTFDVDHSTGDSIELEFTIDQSNPQEACRFLLFKFGDGKTYLSSGSSINRTFTFNSDGVTEVKVIGQPSFAGVTEVELEGPILADTVDLSWGIDINTIRTGTTGENRQTLIGPFGGDIDDPGRKGVDVYPPNVKEIDLSGSAGDTEEFICYVEDISTLSPEIVSYNRSKAFGVWSDVPDSVISFSSSRQSGSITGTTEAGNNPASLENLNLTGENVDVSFQGLIADLSNTLKTINLKFYDDGNMVDNDLGVFLNGMNALEIADSLWNCAGGDLSLQTDLFSPPLKKVVCRGFKGSGYPISIDQNTEVERIVIPKTYYGSVSSTLVTDSSKDSNAFVDELYQKRDLLEGLMLDFQEIVNDSVEDGGAGQRSGSTLTQDSLDKIVGVGTYAEDGILDAEVSIVHDTIYQYECTTQNGDEIHIEGDRTEIIYSDDSREVLTTDRFKSDAKIRIINHPESGEYTIDSATYDSTNNVTIVTLKNSPGLSSTTGEVFGAAFIPLAQNDSTS